MDKELEQAIQYFKQSGFHRLFLALKRQYISLGRLGGTIRLTGLSSEEKDALTGFLQVDYYKKNTCSITVDKIEKALVRTRFSMYPLEHILHHYFTEQIITKKELVGSKEQARIVLLKQLEEQFINTPAGEWLQNGVLKREALFKLFIQDFNRDYTEGRGWIQKNFPIILHALNELPMREKKHTNLVVFASVVSGNPHYFDEGTRCGLYFLHGIAFFCGKEYHGNATAEEKAELLYFGGLLRDDLSNWVLCYNIEGISAKEDRHKGMHGFGVEEEALILTLQTLSKLIAVKVTEEVYVVENPAIFSWLLNHNQNQYTLICSGGQLRLAVLVLLDLVVKQGSKIYYARDFDPEGLGIAQRLWNRYPNQLYLWNYEADIYDKSLSYREISMQRLKQLDKLKHPKLLSIAERLKETKRAGYQENILDLLKI